MSFTGWVGRAARVVRADLPSGRVARRDLLAAVPSAVSSIPDGMASGVLAGVSPVQGLYASVVGPIAGGAVASTRLMVVTTTSAAALAAGSAIADQPAEQRAGALALLTLIAGAVMVAAAAARLGRYTRFVSHSVLTGFLTGVAVNIVCGQLGDLTGTHPSGDVPVAKAVAVLTHPDRIDVPSLLTGAAALALLVGLARTRVASLAAVLALAVPTVAVSLLGGDTVARVDAAGPLPTGLPLPGWPALNTLSLDLVLGAVAVAAIVLVQGAGVAQAAPNPDGSRSHADRDFTAQGAGNIAAGVFGGQPVGGSVGATALNIASGARTRWAGIFSGLLIAVMLLVFSPIIGLVAMPSLAALLIYAGVGAINPAAIAPVFRASPTSAVALVATLIATLVLPIAAAVGVGIALSLLLQLNQEAMDLRVVELVPTGGGEFAERSAPRMLASRTVTVLDVYGSLLYAGARTLQARLPEVGLATDVAVVLRVRGRTQLGATFFLVVADFGRRLEAVGGRLYLSGVDAALAQQLARVDAGPASVTVVTAQRVLGRATAEAWRQAQVWVANRPDPDTPEETKPFSDG